MANRYSVLLEFLENLNSHLILEFEGKIKIISVTYLPLCWHNFTKLTSAQYKFDTFNLLHYENVKIKKVLMMGAYTIKYSG